MLKLFSTIYNYKREIKIAIIALLCGFFGSAIIHILFLVNRIYSIFM